MRSHDKEAHRILPTVKGILTCISILSISFWWVHLRCCSKPILSVLNVLAISRRLHFAGGCRRQRNALIIAAFVEQRAYSVTDTINRTECALERKSFRKLNA
mmetsp:Transcript_2079/g.1505  ORF Transcript_2079/g.1505 Transcript_2079/m.1505 type:complete len:102 (-) Transcript_2079:161-466(-)